MNQTDSEFRKIYTSNRHAVFAYLLARVDCREVALDLLQESFLRLWRNFETFKTKSHDDVRRWILAVARNLVIDYYRRERTRKEYSQTQLDERSRPSPSDFEPAVIFERNRFLHDIEKAIAALPNSLREVVTLRYIGNLSYREIGNALGMRVGTARNRLFRAKRLLREQLRRKEGAG